MDKKLLLTIAGFDTSANAGFLADIKTFGAYSLDSLVVNTANTIQTDKDFLSANFFSFTEIKEQLIPLINNYKISAIKIGIIKDFFTLEKLVNYLKEKLKTTPIILDPIFSASSGFNIQKDLDEKGFAHILEKVSLVTPNKSEFLKFKKEIWFKTNCYIKSFNESETISIDYAYINKKDYYFEFKKIKNYEKHGSGCVFSAAVLANLVKTNNLLDAVNKAGVYLNKYLKSSNSLRGVHFKNE